MEQHIYALRLLYSLCEQYWSYYVNWKEEITQYYESKKPVKIWNTKEEVISFFDSIIIPAFEAIEAQLKPFVKNVKIKKHFNIHTFSANISFEEREIKQSVFHAKITTKSNSISFPHRLNECSTFGQSMDVEREEDIGQVEIIEQFMVFFNSREKQIKNFKKFENMKEDDY